MRYIMKGGVWKNSEDEILKAAIMKYGLNQWSRISSLLQRKSAKQCKQRWYEWLDPSIKKTEWTRAEDEKLLQLARVFPSQWRTIAPFVGRTPTQCYERYEKLLDVAQGKSIKETEDLKKLRPGEIDPNPETKPARLDAIDMDEDEKEMLAEVRVRLANTKGKKAKRKEREKIIEEARRLAQLQKVRELEMAGVDNIPTTKEIKRMKQNKSIDYNKEIPFKREVPEFKYSHQDEITSAPKGASYASTIELQTLEGKRRDVEEELQRKLDKRRLKKLKERDLKTAMGMKNNNFEKPASFPIELPQPQITEKDLEDMKRYNITTPLNSLMMSQQQQSDTPYGMTPSNKVLFSARVNMSLNHQDMADEDMDGVDALNYLKKVENDKKMGLNQPMRSIDRVISERMKTPLASEWEGASDGGRKKIQSLFKGLSKPQNEVEFEIPEEDEEEDENVQERVMDAEEAHKLEIQRMAEEELKKRQEMASVMRREAELQLPRPKLIPEKINLSLKSSLGGKQSKVLSEASNSDVLSLIQSEMASLLYSDGIDYPIQNSVFPQNPPSYKQENINPQSLQAARELVEVETKKLLESNQGVDIEELDRVRKRVKLDFKKQVVTIAEDFSGKQLSQQQQTQSEKEHLSNKLHHFLVNSEVYQQSLKHTQSNAKKCKKLLGGYEKLIKAKTDELNNKVEEAMRVRREKEVLSELRDIEREAMKRRLEQLNKDYELFYGVL